jgi:hypothetical protein
VVANDTEPLHLANAVGAATVGIYWCQHVVATAPLLRTRDQPLVAWRLNCPACGRDSVREGCDHRVSYVADVPVDAAIAAAMERFIHRPVQYAITKGASVLPSEAVMYQLGDFLHDAFVMLVIAVRPIRSPVRVDLILLE